MVDVIGETKLANLLATPGVDTTAVEMSLQRSRGIEDKWLAYAVISVV
jgi:uncharacterized membrane protein